VYKLGSLIIVWKDGIQFVGRIFKIDFIKEEYTIFTEDKKDMVVSFYEYIDYVDK